MEKFKYEKIMRRQAVEDHWWIAGYSLGCRDKNIAYQAFIKTFGRKPVPFKRD